MTSKKKRRSPIEINAGSMADIAFLLLIFFLVTTTITAEKGIQVKLPPYDIGGTPPPPVPKRNVLNVLVNFNNDLLVEGEMEELVNLKNRTIEFLTNPNNSADLPTSPKKAVVSLQNDRSTDYATYLATYNEIRAGYNHVWDEYAKANFNEEYENLTVPQKKKVQEEYPLVISEAEPSDISK